jgi:hypothetical protein
MKEDKDSFIKSFSKGKVPEEKDIEKALKGKESIPSVLSIPKSNKREAQDGVDDLEEGL